MLIHGDRIQLQCNGNIGCYRIVLAEQVVIPAGSEIMTTGRCVEPGVKRLGLGVVEPTMKSLEIGKGIAARTLVKANDIIPIRLANFSKEAQTLYPNTNIAIMTQVDKVEEPRMKQSDTTCLPEHMHDVYNRASDGLQKDVRIYVNGCETCMTRKGPNKTKQAPMQIVRSGYPMERIAIDILGELPETESEKMESAHAFVRQSTGKAMLRQKQIHDKRTSYEHFSPSDKVYVYFPVKKSGTSSKLTSFWRGPYTVVAKFSDVLYKID
ncbi:hypothetical protein MAR_000187, partial [Mya arenaria]